MLLNLAYLWKDGKMILKHSPRVAATFVHEFMHLVTAGVSLLILNHPE